MTERALHSTVLYFCTAMENPKLLSNVIKDMLYSYMNQLPVIVSRNQARDVMSMVQDDWVSSGPWYQPTQRTPTNCGSRLAIWLVRDTGRPLDKASISAWKRSCCAHLNQYNSASFSSTTVKAPVLHSCRLGTLWRKCIVYAVTRSSLVQQE